VDARHEQGGRGVAAKFVEAVVLDVRKLALPCTLKAEVAVYSVL
jgi:hypothetical protein